MLFFNMNRQLIIHLWLSYYYSLNSNSTLTKNHIKRISDKCTALHLKKALSVNSCRSLRSFPKAEILQT